MHFNQNLNIRQTIFTKFKYKTLNHFYKMYIQDNKPILQNSNIRQSTIFTKISQDLNIRQSNIFTKFKYKTIN